MGGVFVVALTVLAFLGSLQNGFVNWDDPANFLDNPRYRGLGPAQLAWMFTAFHMGHYIPVTWLTLGADYLVWGMHPTGYHLTSLLFHAATALGLYVAAGRLLAHALPAETPGNNLLVGAVAAALFFSLHPLRVESVAWITERRDVVSGLFFVLTVLAWLEAVDSPPPKRRRWYVGSIVLCACALLSKSLTVGLPVAMLVLDVYPLRRLGGARGWWVRSVWLEKLPYFLLGGVATVLAFVATPASAKASLESLSLGSRLLVASYGVAFYLWKTVLPVGLSPLYAFVTSVSWVLLVGLVLTATLVAAMWRKWPAVGAAAVVYLILLFPTLGFFATGPQAVADRYSYLPSLGWALVVGGLVAWPWAGARLVQIVAAVGLAALLVLTTQQVSIWHDSVTLWSRAVALEPGNRFARINLGGAYVAEGRTREAIEQYREVLNLSKDKAPWYEVLGWLHAQTGRVAEALPLLLDALRLEPGRPGACANAREAVRLLNVPPPPELAACR